MAICTECKEDKKHYAKGLCQKCYMKFDMRRFRILHPEKDHERKRKWYLEHKEQVCFYRKRSRLLKKYNITLEQLEKMKKQQKYLCLICKEKLPLNIDHDHNDGFVRGLLCDLCNRGLGYFKDNPEFLVNAAEYIIKSNKLKEGVWPTRM